MIMTTKTEILIEATRQLAESIDSIAGGADSPDVICEELAALHFEVKCVQALNLEGAIEQASRDAGQLKDWVVAHKKDRKPWRVTISTELFFRLLRDGMDGLKKLPK